MNTIPSIGPDAGIGPRTGSASPQTPAQQRADSAPTVIADSGAAAADPGVMLKIAPPVQPRTGDASVRGEAGGLPSTEALAQALGEQIAPIIESSGEQADLAIAKRISEAFAALPPEVQEAIKQASSPAIAHLLRLAAMTAPGIREAPAHILSSGTPMGETPEAAAQQLHATLRGASPFEFAKQLREALLGHDGAQGAQARQWLQQLGAMRAQAQANLMGAAGLRDPMQGSVHAAGAGLQGQAASAAQGAMQGLSAGVGVNAGMAGTGAGGMNGANLPGSVFGSAAAMPASQGAGTGAALNGQAAAAFGLPNQALSAAFDALLAGRDSGAPSASFERLAPLEAGGNGLGSAAAGPTGAVRNEQALVMASPLSQWSPQQGEQAMREGLKILMDGRMLWQGQFTPGVPMAMERSDAWRADREALGGMQKGSALRFRLSLPSLGDVEIRAVGFGGQVAARVQVHAAVAGTLAQALPALQARLRERGLAGAQVAVEAH